MLPEYPLRGRCSDPKSSRSDRECRLVPTLYATASDLSATPLLILDSSCHSQSCWQRGQRQNVSPSSKISSSLQQSLAYNPSSRASSEVFISFSFHCYQTLSD